MRKLGLIIVSIVSINYELSNDYNIIVLNNE